ncbi:Ferric reductase like transmembrane component/FAD-binding domain/Ferric reductase NAD binding domain containing protein, putative [Angomonas deanei]|uniref:Ferric reductase like transmembrane component/FAD-binding domain/Ferric reductase NAD binding domain containing protein, putative n=1 Tax=Angomonas deanei TaxID=59799 RepID=A0A7G2CJR2_9TRYP|nr:Ferric reductase like transmembrane component/FAD-binding domain/Ferric reductase NAD binding domain containing protein, putative [Angomonas deanei]
MKWFSDFCDAVAANLFFDIFTASVCLPYFFSAVFFSIMSLVGLVLWRNHNLSTGTGMTGTILFITVFPIAIHQSVLFVQNYMVEALAEVQLWRRALALEGRGTSDTSKSAIHASVDGDESVVFPSNHSPDEVTPISTMETKRRKVHHKVYLAHFFLFFTGALAFALGCVAFFHLSYELTRCGYIFCVGDPSSFTQTNSPGGSTALIGLMLGCVLCPLGALLLFQFGKQLRRLLRMMAAPLEEYTDETAFRVFGNKKFPFRIYKDPRGGLGLATLAVALFLLLVAAVLTFYLPNDFHRINASRLASAAATVASRNGTRFEGSTLPEKGDPVFRTSNIRISEHLVLKLFPGNVFFYVYLMMLAVLATVLRWSHKGKSWFQRRLTWAPKWSQGEAVLVAFTGLLLLFFCIYWFHDHNYKQAWSNNEEGGSSRMGRWERWARALGQVAVLFLSLLLFPISRNSLVHDCIGTTWENFLKLHRLCGYAMTIVTFLHMIAFFVSYYEYGKLWHNLFSLPTYVGYKGIRNDFTVMAITYVSVIMFITMGIFAYHPIRRRFYELFYYSHIITSAMLVPLTIVHASAAWMYLLPGMTLWCADQMTRLWQKGTQVEVLSTRTVGGNAVEIVFNYPRNRSQRQVRAGQYVFLSIPCISVLQWHPMTLTCGANFRQDAPSINNESHTGASPVQDGEVYTIYIKSMGEGTWSHQVFEHVRSGKPLTKMGVDGPYGTPIDFTHYDQVYFFAGGIGITPCATMYSSILRNSVVEQRTHHVRLVWATRSASLVGALAGLLGLPDRLQTLSQLPTPRAQPMNEPTTAITELLPETTGANPHDTCVPVPATNGVFECHLYMTEERAYDVVRQQFDTSSLPPEATVSSVTRVMQGRPDVADEVADGLRAGPTPEEKSRILLFICGPKAITEAAVKVGAEVGATVHVEEFLF